MGINETSISVVYFVILDKSLNTSFICEFLKHYFKATAQPAPTKIPPVILLRY